MPMGITWCCYEIRSVINQPFSPHCRKWKMHLSCNVTSPTKNAIEKYLHYHFGAVIVTFVIQDGVCSSSKMFCQSIKMEGAGRRV